MNKSRFTSRYHLSETPLLCTSHLLCRRCIPDPVLQRSKKASFPTNMGNAARRSMYHCTLSLRVFMLYTHSLHVIHDHNLLFLIPSLGSLGGPDRSLLGFPQPVDLSGIHVSLPESHIYLLRCMTSTVLQTLQWTHCLSSELEAHSCCDLHYRNIICANIFIQ